MSEKRKSERVKQNIKSEVHSDEHVTLSSTVDLGTGGIFISTPEPLSNGTEVELSIMLPDNESVKVKGVVKWIRKDDSEEGRTGMGIEFLNPESDAMKKIDSLIS